MDRNNPCHHCLDVDYALYLTLFSLLAPSPIIKVTPISLDAFRTEHPIAVRRMLSGMVQMLALEAGLTPCPIPDTECTCQ
jgi:hypothetical protein